MRYLRDLKKVSWQPRHPSAAEAPGELDCCISTSESKHIYKGFLENSARGSNVVEWLMNESALVNPMRGSKHVFDVASYERNMGRHRQFIDIHSNMDAGTYLVNV